MSFLTPEQLQQLGLKQLGRDVKISDKAVLSDPELLEIGDRSRIDDFCVVTGNVRLGCNVHLATMCNVRGGREGIVFEDFSGLAYNVQLFTQSDDYVQGHLTNPTVPGQFKQIQHGKILVGRHCIVGTSSVIFPGVTLAIGSSVGAMSLVRKSTKPWTVYRGIPAIQIARRNEQLLLQLEQEYLRQLEEQNGHC